MFTTQQQCQWWGQRWKFTRTWKYQRNQIYFELSRVNYRNLLVAAFSHLFEYRLKQSGRAI